MANTRTMITVVLPTLDAGRTLPDCLTALIPAAVDGTVREVIVVDGGSHDDTRVIADAAGARVVETSAGRGRQIAAGVALASQSWVLVLHADTVLEVGWHDEVAAFIERQEAGTRSPAAAAFRFALDDDGFAPRLLETVVGWRSHLLKLPYGDQGLLVPRALLAEVGGFRPLPIMEDVDIVRRLGRRRLRILRSRAITNAARFREEGYLSRVARNQICMAMYTLGVPPERIARYYRGRSVPTRASEPVTVKLP
ncbi:MAG: TIGR04283 family arsenosugar biosynthesis glycosyltransferase [Hyphomicrobiaceae bacterium]|nr:TIGR04283 family arsenosugar biosynthesis glycosyltransferase [Hyphomicrobiaceae bacterium]